MMKPWNLVEFLFISTVVALDVDPNGYILYCPCMGRFGNQADHFLGSLAFAKALDRTLVLPPWVEYGKHRPTSSQIPFDTYFQVRPLLEYHRVLTMEEFMKQLAPTVWPPNERMVLCYQGRSGKEEGCNAKEGNPFGPFWDAFNIDFVKSEYHKPLFFDVVNKFEVVRWQERFPMDKYPVLAFTGAPAAFPVQQHNLGLHKYLKWSVAVENKANKFISENIPEGPFIGIHLRLGTDFDNACGHITTSPTMFAAAQCLGYRGERGTATKEMCYPSDKTIVNQVEKAVQKLNAKAVFIATDSRDLISQFSKVIKKVKFVRYTEDDPHVDLAILGKADHFIGNCISTFSAFAKRERDVNNKTSEFWAFGSQHDEL